ncbi:MAG: cation diffusion facilitator family transporter [Tissierella sp.]|uniref:cation diffusion facilitator family transporter n=1 Tax=Tissierella sp. TaxID=41274 RepID=UPI003F955B9A
MTNFLIKLATKDIKDPKEKRQRIGYMASIVSIIINIILSVLKLTIGLIISSISVIGDGFNNVTDTLSSIITLIGFKVAHLPPDKEHPYGHGRVEYITGLIVSFLVMLVGFQFIISSFKEILNPTRVKFELGLFTLLILSIIFKVWLSYFNKKLSEKINSTSLKAVAIDSLGDVLTTSVVVLSLLFGRFTSIPIDGYMGVVVALLIIYNGYNIIKETVSPLIGEAPSIELIRGIEGDVLSYKYISGVHDLHIHSYGENKRIAVIDAEFSAQLDIVKVYGEIVKAEREIGEKYGLNLVIHMDPLDKESDARYNTRKKVQKTLKEYEFYKSMHDFDIRKEDGRNIIEFDMVIYGQRLKKSDKREDIRREIEKSLKEKFPKYNFHITLDIEYH